MPSVSFPASVEEDMSVNMELCGMTGEDARLLGIAQMVEDSLGVRDEYLNCSN